MLCWNCLNRLNLAEIEYTGLLNVGYGIKNNQRKENKTVNNLYCKQIVQARDKEVEKERGGRRPLTNRWLDLNLSLLIL